jgi:pyruvate dehydrogenase E2 component (dihydrolipoamide acetyltransferase)
MPRLSDTMSEGTIGRWLKQPGDSVVRDEVIAEIETDKATMELVSFESGTLVEILVNPGQTVSVGTPIAMVGPAGSAVVAKKAAPASAPPEATPAKAAAPPAAAPAAAAVSPQASAAAAPSPAKAGQEASQRATTEAPEGSRVRASPLARGLATSWGLDLAKIEGTGPNGRVLRANVEAYHAAQGQPGTAATGATPAHVTDTAVPMSRMRRAIARAMTAAKPGIPHVYLTTVVEMDQAARLREEINASGASDVKISPNDLVVRAVALALRRHPALNVSYAQTPAGDPATVTHAHINVSVAVETDQGLIAAVVRDTDAKTVSELARDIRALAERARSGRAQQRDLEDATFQTSNLGMFGVVDFVSIIPNPLAASLAIGAIREVPVVRDHVVTAGKQMSLTLSVDHRVVDGAIGARFLQEVKRLLEAPLSLLV